MAEKKENTPSEKARDNPLAWMYQVPRITSLYVENFLSYTKATLEFEDFISLVGPNSSGKSNIVTALRILNEISSHGVQSAIARSGGFELIRHRGESKPGNPLIRLNFQYGNSQTSHYEISLKAVKGKKFQIKRESAELNIEQTRLWFNSNGSKVWFVDGFTHKKNKALEIPVGESVLGLVGLTGFAVNQILNSIHIIDVNPTKLGELQDPSISRQLEPDGANSTSVFENLNADAKNLLILELGAIVPGISNIEVKNLATKQTLTFAQGEGKNLRTFYASQMSDGTLRAFGILLALRQKTINSLIVIEEPERAIHLSALRSLIEIVRSRSPEIQVMITTHSADIVNSTSTNEIRVVWRDNSSSNVGILAEHTKAILEKELMTAGDLLRTDALDPSL